MARPAETEKTTAPGIIIFIVLYCFFCGAAPSIATPPCAAKGLTADRLDPIAGIIEKAVRHRNTPGAVVLVGTRNGVIYRRAFGHRALGSEKTPMTRDTIFDLASLTKAVATTTAVMQLAEKGKLDVEAHVARYWPAFGIKGKGKITVRQLLTHYSGLRPDLRLKPAWSGRKKAMAKTINERPVAIPGREFIYSDVNFEVLGELVRRVSGQTLDKYCAKHIFSPLGMKDTGFRPPHSLLRRIAPTQCSARSPLRAEVNDPSCRNMGGVAGHAGLFSTADDLSVFAQMLLNRGSYHGIQILAPETVEAMTSPQSPHGGKEIRGFGWALEAPFVSDRDDLPPLGAYGHLGYTGTAIWIDPITGTYIIVLTNRVYPNGRGDVKELREQIKKVVADALGPMTVCDIVHQRPWLEHYYHDKKTCSSRP